ncbi:MAG: hypothetical protein AMR96_05015 [Candidatus Adiutrix intracellularis]|jgi:iron complex transport system substrate-binding protein|nr:MAG: hypothetical protein AMR96_05015 [Candidatus Adiutrix intracellularis]MDR2827269.1 ABC transporter substrate-binding protein [Candidatus Adiutrix intracellularis]
MKPISFGLRLLAPWVVIFFLASVPEVLAKDKDDVQSVYGATHPSTFALYALDPDLIAGWNTLLRDYEKKFIAKKYHNLPVLGGWYGEGFTPDYEMLLASKLSKVLYLDNDYHDKMEISKNFKKLGLKVIKIPGGLLETPESFREMGKAFNRKERGEALAAYAEEALAKVKAVVSKLNKSQKPTIYFGQEADGLSTVCRNSPRSLTLELAGSLNVHNCLSGMKNSVLHITFEQLLAYDPDIILIDNPKLAANIPRHPLWSHLRAVQAGQVYLVPRGPFSWLERPATYMRLIGLQWLTGILHPNIYPIDIKAETKKFMRLFFQLEMTNEDVEELLTR